MTKLGRLVTDDGRFGIGGDTRDRARTGVGHSTVREAVMYPSLIPRTKKVELAVDDVEGMQALFLLMQRIIIDQ